MRDPISSRLDYVTGSSLPELCAGWLQSLAGLRGRRTPLPASAFGLVAVDLQRVFVDADSPAYLPVWPALQKNVFRLIDAFIEGGGRPIFTRHAHQPGKDSGVFGHFYQRLQYEGDAGTELTLEATRRIPPGVLHNKSTHDCFTAGLPDALEGCSALILVGLQTQLCILATALGLARLDVVPIVVADACAAPNEAMHLAALTCLASAHAHVVSTAEVLDFLHTRRPR